MLNGPALAREATARAKFPAKFKDIFKPYRYKAFYGGRGSAKSHSIAQALIVMASSKTLRILCAREIQNSIKESVKKLLENYIKKLGLEWAFESTQSEIRNRITGSVFLFMGLRTNIDSVKSLEGIDIAWVEEAANVSETSIEVLRPTLRAETSEIWFSWNPRNATDPVDAMFRGPNGPPPRSLVQRVNWDDNPWFPNVLAEEMAWDKKRDIGKWKHIWGGEYRRISEAQVFTNWREEAFDIPAGVTFLQGADWGFSTDPTVLVRAFIIGRTLYVCDEAYMVGCEIDATPHLFDTIEGAAKWQTIADSARPETISYMQRHGYPKIIAARKGPGSLEEGVEFLKSYDIVCHPRCKHTAYELHAYSYKVDKQTNAVIPILADEDNHVIDALRYAVENVRRASGRASIGTLMGTH